MYSNLRSVQILLSLMKEFEIKDVVLSPGGSDIPIIHSLEMDDYFTCYSVVDERSAAYFAMGLAQQHNRPCACVCTSGTAVSNYVPGITESYYQDAPVLAITADKNPHYQDQLETQKINQRNVFDGIIKKSVELPLIQDKEDEWLCNRLVNEALIALTHHGNGPVQINIPIIGNPKDFGCTQLPIERKITIPKFYSIDWNEKANYLVGKKIMVVVGQDIWFTSEDIRNLESFFKAFDCVFAVEHLSNLSCSGTISYYPYTETHKVADMISLKPDIIISFGNNLAAYNLKPFLRQNYLNEENWLVWERGEVRDAYKCLTTIFECSPSVFLKEIVKSSENYKAEHSYYDHWKLEIAKIELPNFSFSNFYVAQQLSKVIPENSILDTAILNSTRIMQFFKLPKGVRCYSNVGALGIDGCFSTFAGHAASTDQLAFLVTGDLSFFYDMNAAGLRSIGSNVRVILLNNGGGSEFQFFMGKKAIPTIDSYICAEHEKVAAGWVKSLGYDYYLATSKEELDSVIAKFGMPSDKPLFLEVITDMEEDAEKTNDFYDKYRGRSSTKNGITSVIKGVLSDKQLNKAKKIMKILKEK